MTIITMTTGLPASGKSTWAKAQVHGRDDIVRVNLDDIREMLGFTYENPSKEIVQVVYAVQDKAILTAVEMGKDVIVDNTHLNKTGPNRIKKLFDGEITFKVKDFTDVSVEECILRDSLRDRRVGESVIRDMARQLQKPWRLTEHFMNEYEYDLIPDDPKQLDKQGYTREPIVVFDIDGTLARHHRSPYDYSRLGTDTVFEHVRHLVQMYRRTGYMVFIVSGRPDTYYSETAKWLKDNRIPFDELYMRRAIDKRNDADVKHDIWATYIQPDFEVEAWFDDRDRVVRRMRKLGLNVMQVAYGNF